MKDLIARVSGLIVLHGAPWDLLDRERDKKVVLFPKK